tara:strand:+ start:7327 stop:7581 length:255 start_codon:yes stop_codon:yes gene_type:complete
MKLNMKQMKETYHRVFTSREGAVVLEDLERIANQTRISADNPNQLSALYKEAQRQMISRIQNMMDLNETKANMIIKDNDNERRN